MQMSADDRSYSSESSQAGDEQDQQQMNRLSSLEIELLSLPDFISDHQLRHLTKNRAKVPQRRSPSSMKTSIVAEMVSIANE